MTSRQTESFEFTPSDVGRVGAYLETLCDSGDGWINLLPGVVEESDDAEASSGGVFSILFGSKTSPVTMGTLMPPKRARAQFDGVTVGLMHPMGGKVVRQLAELGVELPAGWVVRQDHPRRGLVVRAPVGTSTNDVVGWSVRVGGALCRQEMTGQWRAVVYLP
jgi:hypothetical protein